MNKLDLSKKLSERINIIKNYFTLSDEKEPWQIAATRYCAENSEKGFVIEDLKKYIQSIYPVNENHISQFFQEEIQSPAGRQYSRNSQPINGVNKWTPPLDLVSKITDYDELQEARKSSKRAMVIATGSLIVGIIVGVVQILTSFCK